MLDTPNTQPDTLVHWCVFSVAMFQDKHDRKPKSGEIYKTSESVWRDKQDVYATIGRAYNDKEFLYREERDETYYYGVSQSGLEALWILGMPGVGPRGEDSDELGFSLAGLQVPDMVAEADVPYDATDIPLMESHDIDPEASGNFASSKARKRFFAAKDEEEEAPDEWEPGASHTGEVTFEGEEDLVSEVFGEDEEEEDEEDEDTIGVDTEGVIDNDVGGEPETPSVETPNVPLASFDPDKDGTSPRHESEEEEPEVVGTINLEPDWEWVAVQMVRLGYPAMARRAFNENLSPAEVYGPVLELIYQNRFNSDADLDLKSGPSGLTRREAPVTEEQVVAAKKAIGMV